MKLRGTMKSGACALASMLALASTAHAQEGSASLDDRHVRAEAGFEIDDDVTRPTSEGSPGPVRRYTEKTIRDYYLNVPCGPGRVIGNVRLTEVDPATGERTHLFDAFECVDIPEPGDDGDGSPAAPDPLDIRDAVAKLLPLPDLAVDPSPDGLTGLDTYLWYDDDGTSQLEPIDHDGDPNTPPRPGLSVTATAGPFTITAQAWIEEFTWDMGDGSTYRSPTPGTHEQPAATHVYETKGAYDVLVATVWRGVYTWSVGSLTGTGDLGTVTRSDSHFYRVLEARAVLTE